MAQHAVDESLAPGTVPALGAMALMIFVIANDVTSMAVALPAVEQQFDSDVTAVQWVMTAYALAFGVLIVTGGRLADLYGRRRLLFIGAVGFAASSYLGALAPNVAVLVAARGLMGASGALMWPAMLGIIYAILPTSRAALAGGLVIGTAGVGNAAGPLVGGFLTQRVGWPAILLLNVPATLVALAVMARTLRRDPPAAGAGIDAVGVLLLSAGLVALLVALSGAPDHPWPAPSVLGPFFASFVLLALFLRRERRRGPDALVPAAVLANKPFLFVCLAVLLMSSTWFAALLYLPQLFQKIDGASPLQSGVALLPLMISYAAVSFLASPLVRRIGMKATVTIGAGLIVVGVVTLLWFIRPSDNYLSMVPGMLVLGVGIGLFYSAVVTAGIEALPAADSSLAGGILYTFQVAGGAVGLGLTTVVFLLISNRAVDAEATQLGVTLDPTELASIRGVLVGTDTANSIVAEYPASVADQLVRIVRHGFDAGLRWALLFNALLALGGLVVTVLRVAGPARAFGRDRVAPPTAPPD